MGKKKYKVGYGKPPKDHRFKLGQSGNPKGRPKKDRARAELAQAIGEFILKSLGVQ